MNSKLKSIKKTKYTIGLDVSGTYNCSYAFEDQKSLGRFMLYDYMDIKNKYPNISVRVYPLDGLSIGDTCCVHGDGTNEYQILDVRFSYPYIPIFFLSNGCHESVVKCYRVPKR